MIDSLFTQNDILEAALNAYTVRNEVVLHNIANEDTPEYKKRAVDFEQSFAEAVDKYKKTGKLDLSGAVPKIRVVHENYSYRLDGNNVDIETEMAELYKNSVKYDTLANSVLSNYRKINLVASSR